MKKSLLVFTFFSFLISTAQTDFGIKAGLNYNSFNSLNIIYGSIGGGESVDSKNSVGYHAGIYGQFNFTKLYVRPELLYVQNNGSFNGEFSYSSDFKLTTLELPVFIGFEIIKPLSFYVGPSLIYNVTTDISDVFELDVENDLSLGYAIGFGVVIDKFGIDLRYAGGFAENTASYLEDLALDGNGYTINTSPSQFLLSVSYRIN